MAETVKVKLWGQVVGYLGYEDEQTEDVTFEYDKDFVKNYDLQISPIKMPTSQNIFVFNNISKRTFHGLPGVFADSLPDKFGNQLIDIFMNDRGFRSEDITALDRLMYVGNRGMGALEYEPNKFGEYHSYTLLDIKMLSELSELVITKKEKLAQQLKDSDTAKMALALLRIGSSAGGARSKALVAMDEKGDFYDGTLNQGIDHTYWLLKFDTDENSDRDKKDPKGLTKVEYIYSHHFAKELGIDIPETRYIQDGNDFHYMIERFDRIKLENEVLSLHYASWAGLEHFDRDTIGSYAYEQLTTTINTLKLGQEALTQLFKRAVFNIVGRNQDDHTKNFGFLLNGYGEWSFSPAFDLTFSYDETGKWTRIHQIMFNRKQENFTRDDLFIFGRKCNLKDFQIKEIIDNTIEVFQTFSTRAKEYEVSQQLEKLVLAHLRLNL